MLTSVVICTYDPRRLPCLAKSLTSVNRQTYRNHETVLVVQQDPTIPSQLPHDLRDSIDEIVYTERLGLSLARNLGVKHSSGEIIAFLDDDAEAEPRWLERLIENFREENVVGVGGATVPRWIVVRPAWFPEELDWAVGCTYDGHPEGHCETRNVFGGNMAMQRRVFQEVGFFRESIGRKGNILLGSEEVDFCLRIRDAMPKHRIIYEPKARIRHRVGPTRATLKYVLARAYGEGLSKAILVTSRENRDKGTLSVERDYVFYLLGKVVQNRLRGILKLKSPGKEVMKLATTSVVALITFMGYARGLMGPGEAS